MLVIFLLLQLQFTWRAYIASAFEGVGGASYNTDVAVPSAIPSVSARFIFLYIKLVAHSYFIDLPLS